MLEEKSLCTGCGACAAVCPLNCIEMQCDYEGFRYPAINASHCISCLKCNSVCPLINKPSFTSNSIGYAVKHKDENIRYTSSSGGIFFALASLVLAQGGVVCGAAYTDNFCVEHKIIDNIPEISKLQGAKYSQSHVEHLFPKLETILKDGSWLLFVGTPCQVAGFKAYLTKNYEKLILVDMICHGVPSPMVWQRYLAYRSKKDAKNSKIVLINQRDKVSGWSRYRYSLHIDYDDGKTYCVPQSEDPYMKGFVNNLYLRPSCAQCQFKGLERCSDLTLGDYWGIWEQHPEFDDDKGVSLVLINTEKGDNRFQDISNEIDLIPVNALEALHQNPSAFKSSEHHPKREEFFLRLENSNFEKLVSELLFGMCEKKFSIQNILRKLIKK